MYFRLVAKNYFLEAKKIDILEKHFWNLDGIKLAASISPKMLLN